MNKRPINLDLFSMRFPLAAVTSILHRASGVLIFLLIPLLLYAFSNSLSSESGFNNLRDCFAHPLARFVLWVGLSGLVYHFIAGIRHLLMDCGIGESLEGGRKGAAIVLALSFAFMVIIGVWLW